MSFPGLVSKVTIGEHELSIQTESGPDFISTQVFAKGATLLSVRTPYEPTAQLMALERVMFAAMISSGEVLGMFINVAMRREHFSELARGLFLSII